MDRPHVHESLRFAKRILLYSRVGRPNCFNMHDPVRVTIPDAIISIRPRSHKPPGSPKRVRGQPDQKDLMLPYLLDVSTVSVSQYNQVLHYLVRHQPQDVPSWIELFKAILAFGRHDLVRPAFNWGIVAELVEYVGCSGDVDISDHLHFSEKDARKYDLVMSEVRRWAQLKLTPFIQEVMATLDNDTTILRSMLQQNPQVIFQQDGAGCNALPWGFLSNNKAVIDLLVDHFLSTNGHRNTVQLDLARRCLGTIPLAEPNTVDEILNFVHRILPRNDDFLRALNEASEVYRYFGDGVKWRKQPGEYLIVSALNAGNIYAVEQLKKHGADVIQQDGDGATK